MSVTCFMNIKMPFIICLKCKYDTLKYNNVFKHKMHSLKELERVHCIRFTLKNELMSDCFHN